MGDGVVGFLFLMLGLGFAGLISCSSQCMMISGGSPLFGSLPITIHFLRFMALIKLNCTYVDLFLNNIVDETPL